MVGGRTNTRRTGTNRPRGNRGGTGRQRTNDANAGGTTQQATMTCNCTSFKGNTEGMCGHVFECFVEEQNDRQQYGKTVEALDAYARKTLPYSAD